MKKEFWKNLVFILVALLIVGAIVFYKFENPVQASAVEDLQTISEIQIGNSPVLGEANAPIVIYVFSDFSCPFCGAASGMNSEVISYLRSRNQGWIAPVPNIIKDYVETGKAKLVFKWSMGHSGGKPAQLVGWCLNEQGLFWKFHDLAFANQESVENIDEMKKLASEIGADSEKLDACLSSGKYSGQFDVDSLDAQKVGVQGTPAFYVNNVKLPAGAISYPQIKYVIDEELGKN